MNAQDTHGLPTGADRVVKKMRKMAGNGFQDCEEAADTIDRLTAELADANAAAADMFSDATRLSGELEDAKSELAAKDAAVEALQSAVNELVAAQDAMAPLQNTVYTSAPNPRSVASRRLMAAETALRRLTTRTALAEVERAK